MSKDLPDQIVKPTKGNGERKSNEHESGNALIQLHVIHRQIYLSLLCEYTIRGIFHYAPWTVHSSKNLWIVIQQVFECI